MSITARNHIRRRAANAIRMKYEIPSAKIFTTLRIRRVEARPLAENVERISPRGLVVIKRFGARISVLIIARSLRFVQHIPLLSFSYLFPYLSVFISFSFSPSPSPTLFLSIHLSRSIAPFVSLLILDTLSLSPFRCSNRTSIKRSLFFNHKCIKCRDQFSPHDRALFVCRRRFNLLSSARFDSARLSSPFPLSFLLSLSSYFSFLFSLSFSLLFPFFAAAAIISSSELHDSRMKRLPLFNRRRSQKYFDIPKCIAAAELLSPREFFSAMITTGCSGALIDPTPCVRN